jgi:hypothetical protein
MSFRRGFALLTLVAASACDPEDPCALADEASMEPGQGEDAFTALAEGDRLVREWGSQGGEHVWIALRTHGIDPGRRASPGRNPGPLIEVSLQSAGVEVGNGVSAREPLIGEPESAELLGLRMVLDPWLLYDEETGEDTSPDEAVLTLSLTDACGTTLERALDVRWHEGP